MFWWKKPCFKWAKRDPIGLTTAIWPQRSGGQGLARSSSAMAGAQPDAQWLGPLASRRPKLNEAKQNTCFCCFMHIYIYMLRPPPNTKVFALFDGGSTIYIYVCLSKNNAGLYENQVQTCCAQITLKSGDQAQRQPKLDFNLQLNCTNKRTLLLQRFKPVVDTQTDADMSSKILNSNAPSILATIKCSAKKGATRADFGRNPDDEWMLVRSADLANA